MKIWFVEFFCSSYHISLAALTLTFFPPRFQNHRYKCKRQEKEKTMTGQSSINCANPSQFSLNSISLMHHNQFQASHLNSCSTNSEHKYALCLNGNQVNSQLNLSQNNTSDLGDLQQEPNDNETSINSPAPSLSPKKYSKDSKCR